MLATVTALAAVTLATRPTISPPPLGWRALVAILVAAAALAAFPLAEAASPTATRYPGGAATLSSPLFGIDGLLRMGLLAVAVLVVVIRSEPAARRRVIVLTAPVVAVAALVEWTFGGFLASSPRFDHPVMLSAPQWAALVLVPVAAVAAGLILVGRHERTLRQVWLDGAASGPRS